MTTLKLLKGHAKIQGVKSMGIYTATNFFGKGLSFLLLPLFTNPRFLSTADNGLLSLYGQAAVFALPFINLGVLQSASVDYFKLNRKDFRDFCTTGIFMSVMMTLVTLIIFYLARHFLFTRFSFPPAFIWAIPIAAMFNFFYEFIILIIRNRDEAARYMKVNMSKVISEFGLAVLLIVVFAWGWKGRITGILVATGSVSVYAVYFLIKNDFLFGTIRRDIIYAEIKYSIPVIVMQLSMFCLFSSDSFLLAGITGNTSEVGIYGMACVFGSALITLSGALIQYMIPQINQSLSCQVIDYKNIGKLFWTYLSIMGFAFLVLLFCVPLVYHLFINSTYWPGVRYYYYLSGGYFFWTITVFLYSFLLYYKQKKKLLVIAICSILVSLGSNYFFIRKGGAAGAAISVCCSYFVVMIIAFIITRKHWRNFFHPVIS
ncbi:MAG TPA: polysaccharide biosynthesis C-terminal domain-containing protein [Chitinophagaceae bacterium]|nr:polysaccharide biosynthesis C-terminal domain-containing protein [Chitinophagaceae bacterium]